MTLRYIVLGISPFGLLLGSAPVPQEDVAVLRAALAEIGSQGKFCVSEKLSEPPFASAQRDLTANAERPLSAKERSDLIRQLHSLGWVPIEGGARGASAMPAIAAAAVAIAERSDPKPLPANLNSASDLNSMDAADPPADATPEPVDYGQIDPAWLPPDLQLSSACRYPSANLSAIAREGDVAFVSVGIVGAPLAGLGETWAMRRTSDGWHRVARRREWIS